MLQPLAPPAIARLVMVLVKMHKVMRRQAIRRPPMAPLPIPRVLPVIHIRMLQRLVEVPERAEIGIVPALPILRLVQEAEQRVMKVIAPLRIQPIPIGLTRAHNPRIVQVALGNQVKLLRQRGAQPLHLARKLLQKVHRRQVEKRMDRVEPQPVAVVLPQPHQRVIDKKPPYLIAALAVQIHRIAPRRLAVGIQVRPKLRRVVPHRPEVVVHHVQNHAQPAGMARIHKPLKPIRSAIRLMRRKQRHAIVPPTLLRRPTPPPASPPHARRPARPASSGAESLRQTFPPC